MWQLFLKECCVSERVPISTLTNFDLRGIILNGAIRSVFVTRNIYLAPIEPYLTIHVPENITRQFGQNLAPAKEPWLRGKG